MLRRANRLAKDRDIKRVTKNGRSFLTPFFRLRYSRSSLPVTRFTIVIPGRVAKRATDRKRVQRQLREALRRNLGLVRPGNDVVVYVRTAALGRSYKELEVAILTALATCRLAEARPANKIL